MLHAVTSKKFVKQIKNKVLIILWKCGKDQALGNDNDNSENLYAKLMAGSIWEIHSIWNLVFALILFMIQKLKVRYKHARLKYKTWSVWAA
jgi:hypothetical protein